MIAKKLSTLGLVAAALLLQACAKNEEHAAVTAQAESAKENIQAEADASALPTQVFFGDTHLHTTNSFDAGAFGNTLTPETAYRYAMGEEVTASMGLKTKLVKPLDFLVVADHSDNMGMVADLYKGDPDILSNPMGKQFYDDLKAGKNHEVAIELIKQFSQGTLPDALNYDPKSAPYKEAWDRIIAAAEAYNKPGEFTAFIGYEWTSLVKGGNMHRVVIYRDDADKGSQMVPYTATPPYGSQNPRDLWKWMDTYEKTTQGDVLAIAHNGNLANGIMFPIDAQYDGKPLDKSYIENRIKWEPLYEITQMKGDGETHPILSPNDEFADFETWAYGNLDLSEAKTDAMLAGEYGREALKRGLELEKSFGINPYKVGLIGATDSHTGLVTVEPDNFFGKMSTMEPDVKRLKNVVISGDAGTIYYRAVAAAGLAGVWAKENTREAIFDAMERKETYAVTSQRMSVRVFGGWNFTEADLNSSTFVENGYANGVPMGGDLSAPSNNQAPKMLITALKDPDAANLDRIQIIKGWLDKEGKTHEKIFDVACANERKIVNRRCEKPVGNTVDVKTATYTNSIGETELKAYWQDPEFNAEQNAFYYVRVLAIPTPRWTTYDAVRYNVAPPKDVPTSIQDRAYTSPIWYTAK